MGACAVELLEYSLVKTSACPRPGRPFVVPNGDTRIYEASEEGMAVAKLRAIDDHLPILVTVKGIVSYGSQVPPARILRVERIGSREKHAGFTVRARIDTLYAKEV